MFSWFRRKPSADGKDAALRPFRPDVSRIAVGDLLIDLELPTNWHRDYAESGALTAWDDTRRFTLWISGITGKAKDPKARNLCVASVSEDAAKNGHALVTISESLAFYRYVGTAESDEGPTTNEFWIAGVGNRQLVLTLSFLEADRPLLDLAALRPVVEHAIRSVQPAYVEMPRDSDRPRIYDLADSQRPWFNYHRREMHRRVQRELGYDADGLIPLEVLDEFWGRFIAAPPESDDAVNAILNGVGVVFGDHLVRAKGFGWVIISDSYGTTLGIVTLRGTADLNSDPMNFVAKRWDRKEPRFLVNGFKSICDLADEWSAK